MVSVQVLMRLPDNLVVSVIRASQIPLHKQLSRLPHVLHMAALHAACPSIAADHSLRLWDTKMRGMFITQDAEVLGRLFTNLSSLQYLDLHGYYFGEKGARALGPHLAKLSSLQHLIMLGNKMGAKGAKALGPHLASLSSLQHLDLVSNLIYDEGARALGPHLANLSFLQYLDLRSNQITGAEGFKALGPHLANLSPQEHL